MSADRGNLVSPRDIACYSCSLRAFRTCRVCIYTRNLFKILYLSVNNVRDVDEYVPWEHGERAYGLMGDYSNS
jgi:hypothetical protein